MGKKNRLKGRKYKYSKYEFVHNICERCGLCEFGTDPKFCYHTVYKSNPKLFIKTILNNLKEVKRWSVNIGYRDVISCPSKDIPHILKSVFCESNYCRQKPKKGQCKHVAGCTLEFRKQALNIERKVVKFDDYRGHKKNKTFGKNERNKQKVVKPIIFPTFFCNDGFKPKVREILDENNNRKQDKIEKPT